MTVIARFFRRLSATSLIATLGVAAACSDSTTSSVDLQPAFAKGGPNGANSIQVTVNGLPAGTNAGVHVSGPGGYSVTVNASTTLTSLGNGSYTLTATNVSASGVTYAPSPASQSVSVNKGATGKATITFAAAPTTGSLTVSITVPNGAPGAVTVTGPNAFSQALTATTTLTSLAPGSYTVSAVNVTSGSIIYAPTPASQSAVVNAGATTLSAVTYAAVGVVGGPDLNLQVLGMYVTQSVQTMGNTVTLVQGRPGVLRVFAIANGTNSVQPSVRARFYLNGTLMSTLTAADASASVPTALNEGAATASWNFAVPAALMQPGLSVLADVDPDNAVAEADESDNQFPISGTPKSFTVRGVPVLNVKFVPVKQSSTGGTGAISAANGDAFLEATRDMLPLGSVAFTVRDTFTTSNTLLSDGTGWSNVLSEVYALRSADHSTDNYFGIVKVGYNSGVAGIGYIGAPAALGWDYLSSGNTTVAHELGHNFGRQHAPCGGVAGPDPNYPYAGGVIGVFGYNVRTSSVVASSTADLMGYCSPRWISDYNYNAMMSFRGFTTSAIVASTVPQEGLLLWGRIDGDGRITLEPAMGLTAAPVLPTAAGRYTLSGSDAAGNAMFSFSFDPVVVTDIPNAGAHFAFVLAMNAADRARLHALTVRGNGRSAERVAQRSPATIISAASGATLSADNPNQIRLRWDATTIPMVIVRNPDNGEILSFARGGDMSLQTRRADVELVFTDGVHSSASRVRVRGR